MSDDWWSTPGCVQSVLREEIKRRDARIEALEAERDALAEKLTALLELNDNHGPFGGEMYQDRVNRTWEHARATLAQITGTK